MKFIKSFTVTINHPYYNGVSTSLYRFESVPRMRQYSKRSVFKFRCHENEVIMARDINKDVTNMPKFVDIAVYPSDPLFQNLSNLEIDYKQGNIYYLCNDPAITDQTDKTIRMTLKEKGNKKEYQAVQVWLRPRQFTFSIEKAKGDFLKLTDRYGTQVRTWTIASKGSQKLLMDLGKWPEGLYLLEKNGSLETRFYVMDRTANKKNEGILKEEAPPTFIIGIQANEKSATAREFQVDISSRAVVWHYVIHIRSNGRKPGNLLIKNNKNKLLSDVSFDRQQLDKKQPQVVFTSSHPIKMLQNGYQEIELYENAEATTPLVHHMPNADASSIHFIDNQWQAQMHVNI